MRPANVKVNRIDFKQIQFEGSKLAILPGAMLQVVQAAASQSLDRTINPIKPSGTQLLIAGKLQFPAG